MRFTFLTSFALLAAAGTPSFITCAPAFAFGQTVKPLAVNESIEMRRLDGLADGDAVSYSPDGKHFIIRISQDDLRAGGTWVEFFVGKTESFVAATELASLGRLFTTGSFNAEIGAIPTTHPALTGLLWIDNHRAAFLWNDGQSPTQIEMINVSSGKIERLTSHDRSVQSFSVLRGQNAIVYALHPSSKRERSEEIYRTGFVAKSPEALETVLQGRFDGESPWENASQHIIDLKTRKVRTIRCTEPVCDSYGMWLDAAIAPDGTLLGVRHERSWRVLRLDHPSATLNPIWTIAAPPAPNSRMLFSPDGNRLIIGPIPERQGWEAELVKEPGIFEVDPTTGETWQIPLPNELVGRIRLEKWHLDGVLEASDGANAIYYRKIDGEWRLTGPHDAPLASGNQEVSIQIRQDINNPPTVHVVDRKTGRERLLLEVEPRLKKFSLGRVEIVTWRDPENATWEGKLFYPVGYDKEKRFPLVVTAGSDPVGWKETFSLFGKEVNVGPLHAAQAMANRNIAVLELSLGPVRPVLGTPQEYSKIIMGAESAINYLREKGLVDPNRVGLLGFSRIGSYVEQIITGSSYPFAAAIASDNIDNSYVQAVLRNDLLPFFEAVNGGSAFGDGLQQWLLRAPGFNAHKIRTPLRLEVISGGVGGLLLAWEMYSRLYQLKKPVELVLVPEPEKAMHATQVPIHKRFSQSGAVDWMDFWLNGHQDPDPLKVEQYSRWRELKRLMAIDEREGATADEVEPGSAQRVGVE